MFKFNDLNELFRAHRLDARMQQHSIEASDRKRLLQMNPLDRIRVARNDSEVKFAVLAARAERALDEIGLSPQRVKQIMASAEKINVREIDNAIRAQCEKIANETNERRRRSLNVYTLPAHETTTVEKIDDRDYAASERCRGPLSCAPALRVRASE